ncbi:hypothetical protein SDC9_43842 [bioreactor metagenome]|uniref:Uncharacterized protein n=1 Tax=bioreactor metagenome TaxID=1076179 RepID=A0A644W2I5_9ZZZZ
MIIAIELNININISVVVNSILITVITIITQLLEINNIFIPEIGI